MATASALSKKEVPVCIKWMTEPDMPEVLKIEEKSFEYPWTEKEFRQCLKERNFFFQRVGLAAEYRQKVVGFVIYESSQSRIFILNLAVHPDFRRKEVGKQIIKQLINKLHPERKKKIFVEVRETNLPAQLFFHQMGFWAICIVRGFYQDYCPEDLYLMQYSLEK
ncbi:MAG: ribosomal protein S18-alanine N-acetyltransferase [Patescibacteria group bacterium]